jgi:hypothetical protein
MRAFHDDDTGVVDQGPTSGSVKLWFARSGFPHAIVGALAVLAGTYVGASGDITLGVGVGANALVGDSGRSIMLQPLSVSGQVGVNLALGVARLTLRPR